MMDAGSPLDMKDPSFGKAFSVANLSKSHVSDEPTD